MRQFRAISFVLALVTILCGCDLGGTVCPQSVEPAIRVEVRDAATGAAAAEDATGFVRDGAYTDSLRVTGGDSSGAFIMSAAEERAGTYDVFIEKAGYRNWMQSGVRVRSGECNVMTVTLQAQLERPE